MLLQWTATWTSQLSGKPENRCRKLPNCGTATVVTEKLEAVLATAACIEPLPAAVAAAAAATQPPNENAEHAPRALMVASANATLAREKECLMLAARWA